MSQQNPLNTCRDPNTSRKLNISSASAETYILFVHVHLPLQQKAPATSLYKKSVVAFGSHAPLFQLLEKGKFVRWYCGCAYVAGEKTFFPRNIQPANMGESHHTPPTHGGGCPVLATALAVRPSSFGTQSQPQRADPLQEPQGPASALCARQAGEDGTGWNGTGWEGSFSQSTLQMLPVRKTCTNSYANDPITPLDFKGLRITFVIFCKC